MKPSRWSVAIFAICFGVAALVALALVWSGEGAYAGLVPGPVTFRLPAEPGPAQRPVVLDREGQLEWHRAWLAYVAGRRTDPPATVKNGSFTAEERDHMDDVRRVFIGAQAAALAAAAGLVALARASHRRRSFALLARSGAAAAALGVAVVGALAALSFDAAFTLFHEAFFPQGNWSFGADSNLLALYPETYFYGLTLRIAASFLALSALVASAAQLSLRGSRGTARSATTGA